MPGLTGATLQSPRIPTGLLNTTNDAGAGVPLSSPSGSITQQYLGQVGGKLYLSADDAGKLSLAATPLFGGIYMYVKVAAGATANQLTQGRLVFWDTTVAEDLYQVNNLESINGGQPYMAGFVLNPAANAITPGNFIWIQIAGRCTALCRATVTNATRNIQWAVAGAGADNATVDGAASAAAVLESGAVATTVSGGLHQYIGVSETVAANAGLIVVVPKMFAFAWRE